MKDKQQGSKDPQSQPAQTTPPAPSGESPNREAQTEKGDKSWEPNDEHVSRR